MECNCILYYYYWEKGIERDFEIEIGFENVVFKYFCIYFNVGEISLKFCFLLWKSIFWF